jgi:hypothetical protein
VERAWQSREVHLMVDRKQSNTGRDQGKGVLLVTLFLQLGPTAYLFLPPCNTSYYESTKRSVPQELTSLETPSPVHLGCALRI